jgi:hypothetical protein
MEPSRAVLAAVVDHLPNPPGLITSADLDSAYDASGGNLREALFGLYDLFEQRAERPAGTGGAGRSESAVPSGADGEK